VRVLFLSRRFFPAISGMSIYAANLLRELVGHGHDVTMVSQYYGDPARRAVYGGGPPPPVAGVRVVGLEALGEQGDGEREGGDFERDVDAMVEAVAVEHAARPLDVIHAQYGYPTGWAALIAARRLGLPCVVSIQGGDGHWVGSCCETHRLAMVRVLDGANALLIGGRSFAEEVRDRLGTPIDRFTLVPGAVDTGRFTPGAGWSGGPVRILYHGRVDRRKGVLDFLHALTATVGNWTATVSGIGPDAEASRALAAELGLKDRVRFTGYADYEAVPALYRDHDVFASPTYAEGFSNTILEAMASGLAVASCRSVGVVDCLRDGENGLLTEAGDVPAHAAALARLVTDHAFRDRLAAAALAEARATYSWTAVGRQITGVYDAVRGRTPGPFDAALPVAPCRFRAEPHLL
jgi:glycosyltransferase involved in cell wall biosynthesis